MKFADMAVPIALDCEGAAGLSSLVHNISGVAFDNQSLWTVSGEGRTVECLKSSGEGYKLAEQISLDTLFPDLPSGKEFDLEGVDVEDGRVWVCGSHCRVRLQPSEDGALKAGLRRRPSRNLLASFGVDSRRRSHSAVSLPFAGLGGLRRRLRNDPFISAFVNLPSKENGLDIEGFAVKGRRAFVGLRGPVIDSFAVVMSLFRTMLPSDIS